MHRNPLSFAVLLLTISALPAAAQGSGQTKPELTGFLVRPTATDTCSPLRVSFSVTNFGKRTIFSQQPLSGFTYALHTSYQGMGFSAVPGRYMVGVSLDGGKDGYPFRWGFSGNLTAGRSARITGAISFPEPGSFVLTPALLRGSAVVSRLTADDPAVTVHLCRPPAQRRGKVIFPPVHSAPPFFAPRKPLFPRYPSFPNDCGPGCIPGYAPFVISGQVFVPAVPFAFDLKAVVIVNGDTIIIRGRGIELALLAGTPSGILNGIPILLPTISTFYGGMPYISPFAIPPIFGASAYQDPYTGMIYIHRPFRW